MDEDFLTHYRYHLKRDCNPKRHSLCAFASELMYRNLRKTRFSLDLPLDGLCVKVITPAYISCEKTLGGGRALESGAVIWL